MEEKEIIEKMAGQLAALAKDAGGDNDIKAMVISVDELVSVSAITLSQELYRLLRCSVEIKNRRAKVKCGCGYIGPPEISGRNADGVVFSCPKCKAAYPQILEGGHVMLEEIELF